MLMKPNVNVENILKVAEYLDDLPDPSQFSMNYYQWFNCSILAQNGHACGAPACIAGYACYVHNREAFFEEAHSNACELFGLSFGDGNELFTPTDHNGRARLRHYEINNKQAAQLLRHLATTGSVDWSILGPEYV